MSAICLQLLQQRPAQRLPILAQECTCSTSRQPFGAPAAAQLANSQHTTQGSRLANLSARKSSWRVNSIPVTGPGAQAQTPPDSGGEQTGQISQQVVAEMKENITSELGATRVDITDTYGDGRHVSIDVVANAFEGLSSVKRQRMVYKAIWLQLQDTVHAVDNMTTKTPTEAGL